MHVTDYGGLKPLPTIRDVAREAGVSVATVSRVINQKGYVHKETASRILHVIDQMGYEPNAVARSLSNRKSNAIALIVPSINNPFFPEVARAVEDVAQTHGYKVFLCNTDDRRDKLLAYLDSLKNKYVDGVIINSQKLTKADVVMLREQKISVVLFDRTLEDDICTSISVKNRLGGRAATEHLVEVGCSRIGHLQGPDDVGTSIQRLWGYRDSVKEFDWFQQSWIAPGGFTVEDGYRGMKELFQRHPDIDGVFAANDLMAIGALKAAYEWGRRVPDDLAIAGFDGISISALTVPAITTVQQPIYRLGELATEQLIKGIQQADVQGKKFELDVQLIQRESTMR